MSPFIGRWEPQHNDTLTGMTVDDEYNMPGFFNDLNLGDDLKNYKTYPKASRSLAAQYAMGKIPQLAKGGLIAELHSGEAASRNLRHIGQASRPAQPPPRLADP